MQHTEGRRDFVASHKMDASASEGCKSVVTEVTIYGADARVCGLLYCFVLQFHGCFVLSVD